MVATSGPPVQVVPVRQDSCVSLGSNGLEDVARHSPRYPPALPPSSAAFGIHG